MMKTAVFLLALALLLPAAQPSRASDAARWEFDVYLNDKKVGKHRFEVQDDGVETRVQSEADFTYTILFIPAYRYEHRNKERWSDNCLVEFEANTNANGERLAVSGTRTANAFRVSRGEAPLELPECVMTFAYWNPEFLGQSRLLNQQTGEYLEVRVEALGEDRLEVRGAPVSAKRFRLTANDVDLSLWYSHDDKWLALESVAKGGHIIRYELS